jgi:hypothetical protein
VQRDQAARRDAAGRDAAGRDAAGRDAAGRDTESRGAGTVPSAPWAVLVWLVVAQGRRRGPGLRGARACAGRGWLWWFPGVAVLAVLAVLVVRLMGCRGKAMELSMYVCWCFWPQIGSCLGTSPGQLRGQGTAEWEFPGISGSYTAVPPPVTEATKVTGTCGSNGIGSGQAFVEPFNERRHYALREIRISVTGQVIEPVELDDGNSLPAQQFI